MNYDLQLCVQAIKIITNWTVSQNKIIQARVTIAEKVGVSPNLTAEHGLVKDKSKQKIYIVSNSRDPQKVDSNEK